MTDPVVLCECFARDGLQHEQNFVSTEDKVAAISAFAAAGFPRIEASSYSNPTRVPAFSDVTDVLRAIPRIDGVRYKNTCPNVRAVERARADLVAGHGADELSFLVSASESHSRTNLASSRTEQWARVHQMADLAGDDFTMVGVESVAFGCPFEGVVDPDIVVDDARRFADLGITMMTIGDTTGVATPRSTAALFERLLTAVPSMTFVAHMHNTRGTGIANAVAAYDAGCRYFDSAMGGVGGHPAQIGYGAGRTGNVCTEDLVGVFENMGISTGLDLDQVSAASALCETILGRDLDSMVARAGYFSSPRNETAHV